MTVLTATQRREVAAGRCAATPSSCRSTRCSSGLGARLVSDPKGLAVTVQRGSHELVLHHKKSLASVDGDLKLLPSPALFDAGRWLVPVEGLARVLPPLLERPVEWRAAQRVLVIGPIVIPKVTVSAFASGELVRVVFEASESVPFRVQQEAGRVTVAVPRDLVDVVLQPTRLAGGIVSSVQFLGGRENVFAVELGPRFQTLKATEQEAPARLVLEFQGPPLGARRASGGRCAGAARRRAAAADRGRAAGAHGRDRPRPRRREPRRARRGRQRSRRTSHSRSRGGCAPSS